MEIRITQPSIERPDYRDERVWATISRVHTDWVRHVAPQLGLAAEKLVLGDTLGSIIGDDENCFGIKAAPYTLDGGGPSQKGYFGKAQLGN